MVVVTEYLVVRFQMRANAPHATKETVKSEWRDGTILYEEEKYEERYSKEYDIVLIRRGRAIKTVLSEDINGNRRKGELCPWCGYDIMMKDSCEKCGFSCKDV